MQTIKLDTRQLDKIAASLNTNRDKVLKAFAFQIEGKAKELAPVDTGAMRASIYTVTKDSDGYESARAASQAQNANVATGKHPTPSGKVIANVGPCVEYAGFVELGTSRMSARPYLVPAVEQMARKLNDESMWREMFT